MKKAQATKDLIFVLKWFAIQIPFILSMLEDDPPKKKKVKV